MFYVYLLRSERDGKFYIGYSGDLKARFREHLNGEVESTKHRRPLELVYYEAYCNEEMARGREEKLKKFGSSYNGLIKRLGSIE